MIEKSNLGYHTFFSNFVFSEKISDHAPVVKGNSLFWNVMMQGKPYNNGFGLTENNDQYKKRLDKVANTLAALLYFHPQVDTVSLCEGPIKEFETYFLAQFSRHKNLSRFISLRHTEPNHDDWGLFLFADSRFSAKHIPLKFDVTCLPFNHDNLGDKLLVQSGLKLAPKRSLINRWQLWELRTDNTQEYRMLGHLPLGADEFVSKTRELSASGNEYLLMTQYFLELYKDKDLKICCDFNFNPNIIVQGARRNFQSIPQHNGIKHLGAGVQTPTTVDGILYSDFALQKFYSRKHIQDLTWYLKKEKSTLKAEKQE